MSVSTDILLLINYNASNIIEESLTKGSILKSNEIKVGRTTKTIYDNYNLTADSKVIQLNNYLSTETNRTLYDKPILFVDFTDKSYSNEEMISIGQQIIGDVRLSINNYDIEKLDQYLWDSAERMCHLKSSVCGSTLAIPIPFNLMNNGQNLIMTCQPDNSYSIYFNSINDVIMSQINSITLRVNKTLVDTQIIDCNLYKTPFRQWEISQQYTLQSNNLLELPYSGLIDKLYLYFINQDNSFNLKTLLKQVKLIVGDDKYEIYNQTNAQILYDSDLLNERNGYIINLGDENGLNFSNSNPIKIQFSVTLPSEQIFYRIYPTRMNIHLTNHISAGLCYAN